MIPLEQMTGHSQSATDGFAKCPAKEIEVIRIFRHLLDPAGGIGI
jgi:hypothetical protein